MDEYLSTINTSGYLLYRHYQQPKPKKKQGVGELSCWLSNFNIGGNEIYLSEAINCSRGSN